MIQKYGVLLFHGGRKNIVAVYKSHSGAASCQVQFCIVVILQRLVEFKMFA